MSSLLTLGHSSGEESRKAGKRNCAVLRVAHGAGTEVAGSQLPGTWGGGGVVPAGWTYQVERAESSSFPESSRNQSPASLHPITKRPALGSPGAQPVLPSSRESESLYPFLPSVPFTWAQRPLAARRPPSCL